MIENKETVYKYRWVIMGILWTAFIVIYAYRLSIGPLAPSIKEALALTHTEVGWIMSAGSLGYMLGMFPAGWATDRFGVRWLLIIGELVSGIFLLGIFLNPSYTTTLLMMALAGFAGGCLMPATTKGVMLWFPANERATVMGFKQTAVNVGGMLAAVTMPTVAIIFGWHYAFVFLGILAVLIGTTSFILYRDPPVSTSSPLEASAFAVEDMAPPVKQSQFAVLKKRDLWLVAVAGFTLLITEFAVIAHLVLYLTEEILLSATTAGFVLAVVEAGGILGKPGGGFLSDRVFGSRRNVYILWGAIASAMSLMLALWGSGLSWVLYPVLFILGVTSIGWGGVHLTLIAELAGKERAGTATGAVLAVTGGGGVLGPIIFGYIVDTTGTYQLAWLAMAASAAICVLSLLFVREDRMRA